MKSLILSAVFLSVVTLSRGQTNSLLASSSPATNRLEGQIYITLQSRGTVKMSLVTVRIVDAVKFKAALALAQDFKIAKGNDAVWRERAEALAAAMPRMNAKDSATAMKTYKDLAAQIKTNLPAALLGRAGFYKILESFDDNEWKTQRRTQTDADGNFDVNLPEGSWYIVAFSRRKILDEEEEYIWMVPVRTPLLPSGRVLLNNSNLEESP